MEKFACGSASCVPDCSGESQMMVNRQIQPSGLGNPPTHEHQQSITSPTELDDFLRTCASLSRLTQPMLVFDISAIIPDNKTAPRCKTQKAL